MNLARACLVSVSNRFGDGPGWYVLARPEGKRVLVVSAKGETVARQMSGAVTHRCARQR